VAGAGRLGEEFEMNLQRMLAVLVVAPFVGFAATLPRVIQTNSAGDNVHVIDPATNKVVGVIQGIEAPHGVVIAPDGNRLYVTEEPTRTLDVVDAKSLKVTKKIKLSGRPNNLAVTNDGRSVYVGIAQPPGAVDVIDTISLTKVKSIPVNGAIHNVYVTPDGKYAVAGSIPTSVMSVIDTATNTLAWSVKLSGGIRPMAFTKNPDGSTKEIVTQLSDFHGFVLVDFQTHREIKRVTLPSVPGQEKVTDGVQGAPSHGLAITPDGKVLWATSKWYDYVAAYSLPDLKLLKVVRVGLHPEWLTIPPDGKNLYVAVAGKDATVVIDNKTMQVVAEIPVGYVPKRNASGLLETE
jgi:YVTN family beta-propeller protein